MMPLASRTQCLENISCLIIGIPPIFLWTFFLVVDLVLFYPGSLFDCVAVAPWQGSASSCLCEGLNEIHWAETVLLPVSRRFCIHTQMAAQHKRTVLYIGSAHCPNAG